MRKRPKISPIKKAFNYLSCFLHDILYCRKNARAAYSAWYILMEFNHSKGIKKMSEFTGLPEGVIAAAFKNIFEENEEL